MRTPKRPSSERRASTRFALALEVRHTISGYRAPVETGSGRTINLSGSGLSLIAEKPLSTGQELDVSIDWPVLLDGDTRLQLIMSGVVVRTNGTAIALKIRRHEFRTRRVGTKAALLRESVG